MKSNLMQHNKNSRVLTAVFIFVVALLVLGSATVDAWTDPTNTPPLGNTTPPVNEGSVMQIKNGVFRAYGIRSYVDLVVDDNAYADAYFYSSDRSLKTDIKPLRNALSNILKLEGVSFVWKQNGKHNIGLVAQDVERIYPELVTTNPTTGLKSVEYGNLVAPLIEAVKEQQKEIESLREEIRAFRASIQ